MKSFDHIFLGTGQATGTLLGKLIETGESIAVIEGGKIGGSCVNYGCTPTKTLVASAKSIHTARRGDDFGFQTGEVKVDFARVRERMNEIRNESNKGLTEWMEETENVTLIREWGEFTGPKTIRAGSEELQGGKIFINTGTRAVVPDIEGLEAVPWLDNAGLLDLEELPEHLLIIGGGYVGVEFSQIFRRLGSGVTLIQRGEQIMPKEDGDVAEAIQEFLENEGIDVLCEAKVSAVTQSESGITLELDSGQKIEGSHLLIASGRRPNSDHINAEKAGLDLDENGYIRVDDQCQTSVDGVYAMGDVNGKGAFTHTSVNDAEIVISHLDGGDRGVSDRTPIYALFTDPPLGRVGMSEKEAIDSGKKVLKATYPMSKISRAKEMGEMTGFAKLLVDADSDNILGAAVLGPGGDEIINMFAVIIHSGIPCYEYRKTVLVHPTVSELMPWVLDGLEPVEE